MYLISDWHSGAELYDVVQAFHEKYARQPAEMNRAKRIHSLLK